MNNGISIYLGLDNTLPENLHLLDTAAKCGIKRIFTSLHIPETDAEALKEQLYTVLNAAKRHNMEVISDVSPNTLALLDMKELDSQCLLEWGITTVRLDFGYTVQEIAKLSHTDLKIQFNASTINREFLYDLQRAKVNFSHIDALHNFYPREGTGLSLEAFQRQNELLAEFGIAAAAFIPSYNRTRSPLKKGLPTLEQHRYKSCDYTMRFFSAAGVQSVFIGDSLPTDKEIYSLGLLNNTPITLRAKLLTQDDFVKNLLKEHVFTVRPDTAQKNIRLTEGRSLCRNHAIMPEYTAPRQKGDITLDNLFAGRYAGELQIITQAQKLDKNVNTIARLNSDELKLLQFVKPESKIKIIF